MENTHFMSVKLTESQFFSLLRLLFGAWLIQHFVFLLPYSIELYSIDGLKVAGAQVYLKDILFFLRTGSSILVLNILAIFFSFGLCFKFFRRFSSFSLFLIWIFFYHQNFLTYTPILPYIGWLLISLSFIEPKEERFFFKKKQTDFQFSTILFHGFWIITALGYSASGVHKFLYSPLWKDGTAIDYVMKYPAAREHWLNQSYFLLPQFLRASINYFAIFIEAGYVLSFFNKNLRCLFWIGIFLMHLMIFIFIKFTELSLGMLIVHAFLIEKDWFKIGGLSKINWKQNWFNVN